MKSVIGLFVCICIAITLASFNKEIFQRHEQLTLAMREYNEALVSTRVSLAGLTASLAAEQLFQQNLAWNLANSVEKFLESNLRPGEMDFIRIFDSNCRPVTAAASIPMPRPKCPDALLRQNRLPAFFWETRNEGPQLSLASSIQASGQTYILVSGVLLDKRWLQIFPGLFARSKTLKLEIGEKESARTRVMLQEGLTDDGRWVASLWSTNLLSQGALYLTATSKTDLTPMILFFNCLAMACGLVACFGFYRKLAVYKHSEENFIAWCRTLAGRSVTGPGEPLPEESLATAKEWITHAFQAHADIAKNLTTEIAAAESHRGLVEDELLKVREQVIANKHFESLAHQLKSTLSGHVARLERMHSNAEDVTDALSQGLMQHAGILGRIMDEWRGALIEQSPRKFFRSLSELSASEGATALDTTLGNIFRSSGQITTQALALTLNAQKLATELKDTTRLAGHWLALVQNSSSKANGSKLIDIILESHYLIKLVPDLPTHELSSLFTPGLSIGEINAPRATFTSAFYHIYYALLLTARDCKWDQVQIRVHSKHKNAHQILIISLEHPGSDKPVARLPINMSETSHYHYEIATKLMEPYGVQIVKLPDFGGLSAFMMNWLATPATERIGISAMPAQPSTTEVRDCIC